MRQSKLHRKRGPGRQPALLFLLALATVGCSGCDRRTESAKAVESAQVVLQAMSGNQGILPASNAARADSYTRVIQALQDVASEGLPGEQSGAQLLLGRAHAGMAEIAAANAAALEARCVDTTARIRAAHDEFLAHHSLAASLASYDPAGDLANLDGKLSEKATEIAAARATEQKLEADLSALRDRAKSAADKARAERTAEGEIRARAKDVSETAREQLVREAAGRKRAGDAHDVESAGLDAEAALAEPRIDQVKREIARLEDEAGLLTQSRADVVAHAAAVRTQAEDARKDAAAAGASVVELFTALKEQREQVPAPTNEALASYRAAVTAADAAGGGSGRSDAAINAGAYQQGLADTLMVRLRGEQTFAQIAAAMSASDPPLPNSAELTAASGERDAAVESAKEEARNAYLEAKEKFAGASAEGDEVQKRLERIAAALESLATGKAEVPAAATAEADTTTTGAPAEQVRATIDELLGALKSANMSALHGHLTCESEADQWVIDAAFGFFDAIGELDSACQQNFGKGLAELDQGSASGGAMANNPLLASNPALANIDKLTAADIAVEMVDDTTAHLTALGQEKPLTMKLVDGKWAVEIPTLTLPPNAPIDKIQKAAADLAAAVKDVAGQVADKSITTPEQMQMTLQTKMMAVVMQVMSTFGAPPAGGG